MAIHNNGSSNICFVQAKQNYNMAQAFIITYIAVSNKFAVYIAVWTTF